MDGQWMGGSGSGLGGSRWVAVVGWPWHVDGWQWMCGSGMWLGGSGWVAVWQGVAVWQWQLQWQWVAVSSSGRGWVVVAMKGRQWVAVDGWQWMSGRWQGGSCGNNDSVN
jgi:hypothetical protein